MSGDRLKIILSRLRRFLEKHEVRSYADVFADLLDQRDMPMEARKTKVSETLFSGSPMGNFIGLAITKRNGHKVEREREANFELSALSEALFEEVKHSVHGEDAKRAIKHFKIYPTTHEEWEEELLSDDLESIFDVLSWITYYHSDWRWVQDWCLKFLDHSNLDVRGLATTCLADLALLHKALDTGKVVPRLQQLLDDPEVQDRAEAALKDINLVLEVFS
jgi:hypothetical protein